MSRTPFLALATLALASLHTTASAADLQIGASIGRSNYRIDTTGATSVDTKDTARKAFLGASLSPHFGVEASLFDLGRTKGSVTVPGVGTVSASARVRGIGVSGVLSAPVGPVSVFAKAGIANVRARAETSVSTALNGSERSWQPTLGFGVAYPITATLDLRGEWERVRTRFPGGEKDNVDMLSFGLAYRF